MDEPCQHHGDKYNNAYQGKTNIAFTALVICHIYALLFSLPTTSE